MNGKILLRTYTNPTRLKFLALSSISGIILAGLIFLMPPNPVRIGSAFVLLFLFCYFLSAFVINHRRRNFLFAAGFVIYFLLRLFELRHPLYLILLIAFLASLELYFKKD